MSRPARASSQGCGSASTRRSGPGSPAGARRGSTSPTRARPAWCSLRGRSRSRACPPTRKRCVCWLRSAAPRRSGTRRTRSAANGLRLNGRGVAAADVANDGRVDVAINTIGGKLVLLHPSGPSGHWLDVELSRFSPGAVVTATLPGGRRLTRIVSAGSSYLSSEDQRVHFGLGAASSVRSLTVRYPWGGESSRSNVAANRVLRIDSPPPAVTVTTPAAAPRLANCTPDLAGRAVGRPHLERSGTRRAPARRRVGARAGA